MIGFSFILKFCKKTSITLSSPKLNRTKSKSEIASLLIIAEITLFIGISPFGLDQKRFEESFAFRNFDGIFLLLSNFLSCWLSFGTCKSVFIADNLKEVLPRKTCPSEATNAPGVQNNANKQDDFYSLRFSRPLRLNVFEYFHSLIVV